MKAIPGRNSDIPVSIEMQIHTKIATNLYQVLIPHRGFYTMIRTINRTVKISDLRAEDQGGKVLRVVESVPLLHWKVQVQEVGAHLA